MIKTTGYNGSAPGPVLRLREGRPVTVEVFNDTKIAELVHWHGLFVPSEVDGSAEEGTPTVPPGGIRRYSFVPRPSGTRWYHSHISAGRDMKRATYTGQFGFLYIEPKEDPGGFDAEVFLALHGWDPHLSSQGDEGTLEVTYRAYSMNSHALGSGEPIRVKEGQKIIFRILNASATEQHSVALPGHKFKVVAMDGNAVAMPCEVDAIEMGPAERVDAVVTMNRPGVWILGEATDATRNAGLGVVVEYANRTETPQWSPPKNIPWDYTTFGRDAETSNRREAWCRWFFARNLLGTTGWTIGPSTANLSRRPIPFECRPTSATACVSITRAMKHIPVHLHRHTFELTRFAGKATAGVRKDVVVVPAMKQVEVDFTADNPGPTLFHCHQQLHMDYGFMTMLKYEG